ncbi:MAG TPA: LysR substrate-binding domain-containing protein [Polyangiaceae bacterium]|nr:LysR substrate-binding domain-containing protein [Polyangiaceae bacterium]
MDLNEVLVFAKVVQAGSFVRAARQLEMPKSTVSRKVVELEARLGARLLERTTRTLRLTDTGRAYFAHAERILQELEAAEAAVSHLQEVPRGLLRVSAPLNFMQLGAISERFLTRYPEVRLEIVCNDRIVDLIAEGFDVAVRVGKLADSTLVARPLATMRNVLVASPALLQRLGVPGRAEQLPGWPCIAFGGAAERSIWELSSSAGKAASVRINPSFIVNDFDVLLGAAVSGLGIALLPENRCVEDARAGRLRRVLPEWSSIQRPLQAVYPGGRHLSPKLAAFLAHLAESFSPPPWELLPAG